MQQSAPSPIPKRPSATDDSLTLSLDTPSSSLRTITHDCDLHDPTPNQASSGSDPDFLWFPESPPLPSPPDSPYSSASVSSFPSVGSSFFFSSAAASPPHHPTDSGAATAGLVIPSLTLPDPIRRPTPYGKTTGEVRLVVVGKGSRRVVGEMLDMDDNQDIIDISPWEGDVIRASTDWIEHLDAHGLEKYEPLKNVEVRAVEVVDDEEDDIIQDHINSLKEAIYQPFQVVADVLHPEGQPSAILANLLSSSSTPLYTALILLVDNPPTTQQTTLLTSLSPVLPIIPLPTTRRLPPTTSLPGASPFRPDNTHTLQRLFRPDTLNLLRSEAADKFLKWREVQRAVSQIELQSHLKSQSPSSLASYQTAEEGESSDKEKGWDKQKWELEYLHSLSLDVARMRARSSTITPTSSTSYTSHLENERPPLSPAPALDPLHLPSLFLFSLSLFGDMKQSVMRALREAIGTILGDGRVRVALVGGVVVGLGVGLGVTR